MKKLMILFFLSAIIIPSFAQSKKIIKEKGITSIKTYEQQLEHGIDDKYLIKEEFFDAKGRLIELKEYARKGEINNWVKYTFDDNGNITEELRLNKTGKIKKRIVSVYEGKLRLSKEYYDSQNRLVKKKSYDYSYD